MNPKWLLGLGLLLIGGGLLGLMLLLLVGCLSLPPGAE
jgi:hypothetical protein